MGCNESQDEFLHVGLLPPLKWGCPEEERAVRDWLMSDSLKPGFVAQLQRSALTQQCHARQHRC